MNESETVRDAVSSSGTGFDSAIVAASAKSTTPSRSTRSRERTKNGAAATTGTAAIMIAVVYWSSRGGYVTDVVGESAAMRELPVGIGAETPSL